MSIFQYVTKRANEKVANEKIKNNSSKSVDFGVFYHFTTRNFSFYVIFDVVNFLVNFVFSRNRKIKS